MTNIRDSEWGLIDSKACQHCRGTDQPHNEFFNNVLASLLFQLSRRIIDQGGIPGCSISKAQSLLQRAEAGLRVYSPPEVRSVKKSDTFQGDLPDKKIECDVILNITELAEEISVEIDSLLRQQFCRITLHLVKRSDQSTEWIAINDHFKHLVIHESDRTVSDFEAVSLVITECASEFIAIFSAESTCDPDRIAFSVSQLINYDGEIFGSSVSHNHEVIHAEAPVKSQTRTIPLETFVFRRTTYLDIQLSQEYQLNDIEFILQSFEERRKIILSQTPLVTLSDQKKIQRKQIFPKEDQRKPNKYHHLYSGNKVTCDVVLPFRDHLDYVEEAIESILSQENCEVVLHLIDDDSRVQTDEFLGRWNQHPNIRCYRNIKNLGQYTSFNNAVKYFESDFVAIQDGDDISLPTRLTVAVNRLMTSNSDIFTGAIQTFGANFERFPNNQKSQSKFRRANHGAITYPRFPSDKRIHFALNGTVVMRISKFVELGGFTDYGSAQRNRAGLDTEFYLRAYYSGQARFFISRELVTKVRRHADSATQTEITGHGSPVRISNREELKRRAPRFCESDFDAREFGALNKYQELTRPWEK